MSVERRMSFRFLVQPEMKSAKLCWRARALTVELIDQSATGFSFRAPKDTDIKLNEIVSLKSWAGDCQAMVVRLTQHRDYLRVGLERTTDIIARPSPARWLASLLSWQPLAASQNVASAAARKYWIAAALVLLGIATVATCLAARDDDADASPVASDPSAESVAVAKELTTPESEPASTTPASAARANAAQSPAEVNGSSAKFERLMTLRNPKIADTLGLSQRQKLEISQLLGDLSSGVARIKPQATRKGQARRNAKINALLSAADSRLTQILTPDQQARWLNDEP